MAETGDPDVFRKLALEGGEQVVVNGALISAEEACVLHVGAGACVLTGRSLWMRGGENHPARQLYYSTLEATGIPGGIAERQFGLFSLLGIVVADQRTRSAQEDCAAYAAALLQSDGDRMLVLARRIVRHEDRGVPGMDKQRAA